MPGPIHVIGYPSSGPFNVIHVGAAAPTMPQPLIEQLAKPGRMFIPGERPATLLFPFYTFCSRASIFQSLFFRIHVLVYVPLACQPRSDDADQSAVGPDGGAQYIYQVDKDQAGNVTEEKLFGVRVSFNDSFAEHILLIVLALRI